MTEDKFARLRANSPGDRHAHDQIKWEIALVNHTLQRLKLGKEKKAISRMWHKVHREYRLTFTAFNEYLPTFPFLLGSVRLKVAVHRDDEHSREQDRFKKFSQVPFVQEWQRFAESVAQEAGTRPIGLIFPRNGFRYGMIIHNDDSEKFWHKGLCWVFKGSNDERIYVQPYTNVLEAIYNNGRGWRPVNE